MWILTSCPHSLAAFRCRPQSRCSDAAYQAFRSSEIKIEHYADHVERPPAPGEKTIENERLRRQYRILYLQHKGVKQAMDRVTARFDQEIEALRLAIKNAAAPK
jgi:hypothetical protein